MNILLIEDSEGDRQLMEEAFKAASQSGLYVVQNGFEGLAFLKKEGEYQNVPRPDLILLDLNMPGKTGLDVLDEIKSDEALQNIPVAILTGSNAPTDIRACSRFPGCRYLLKPSRFPELVELVKTLPNLY